MEQTVYRSLFLLVRDPFVERILKGNLVSRYGKELFTETRSAPALILTDSGHYPQDFQLADQLARSGPVFFASPVPLALLREDPKPFPEFLLIHTLPVAPALIESFIASLMQPPSPEPAT
jgi:hypothetical protein